MSQLSCGGKSLGIYLPNHSSIFKIMLHFLPNPKGNTYVTLLISILTNTIYTVVPLSDLSILNMLKLSFNHIENGIYVNIEMKAHNKLHYTELVVD